METLFRKINKKINSMIISLFSTGMILLILSILVAWDPVVLQIVIGLVILVVAYSFLYAAYKLHALKKDISKHFKL